MNAKEYMKRFNVDESLPIDAWLVTRDLNWNEVNRYKMKTAIMTDMGLFFDDDEANKLYGMPVKVCDGDLGCLSLWSEANHGEPDCYVEYDESAHDFFDGE